LALQFAGRLLKGARELRAIRFREFYVSVPIQRDVPELPFETSSVGFNPRIRSGPPSLHHWHGLSMRIGNRALIFGVMCKDSWSMEPGARQPRSGVVFRLSEPPDWLAGRARRGDILHRVCTGFCNP